MNLQSIFNNGVKIVRKNSPEILTGLGVAGVAVTSYLSAKAAHESAEIIYRDEAAHGVIPDRKERLKKQASLSWQRYIPPVISGSLTIACIIGASRASDKQTAAAVTAYSLGEKAFAEYREKVVEQIGKGKEQSVRDEIAKDHIHKAEPGSNLVVVGTGNVLCCELYSGRYFRSDMETIKKAENIINSMINRDVYVLLNEFYYLLGLEETSNGRAVGWTSDKLLELQFSAVLTPSGEPCMAFDFNYVKPI